MKRPVIEFRDFGFRYKNQTKPTLYDINLTIYEGEKILILGASGSGKSTLASCINGLVPFSEKGVITGSCQVMGKETQGESIFKLSQVVGTVLQDSDAQFVGLSVGEDIAFALENENMPRREMLPLVEKSAGIVGMQNFLAHLPYNLSGGQKQKVALAGVMHGDVQILIFDEPLASLDPSMGMTAIELIDDICTGQKKTAIIIEHRLEDVLHRRVDRIVLMDEGHLVAALHPDEFLHGTWLSKYGIREPLYITAMKYAGCNLSEQHNLSDFTQMTLSETNYKKLQDFFISKGRLTEGRSDHKTVIEVEDVTFSYDSILAIQNNHFNIQAGERIALIGKNGAGKSTMAKLLCGILRPQKGRILLNGEDYLALSIKEISEHIGYVMQNPNQMLVKDIIKDEVALALTLRGYSKEQIEDRVKESLEMCNLYSMRNWPVSSVSYGQRKRLTIAVILTLRPDTLILDEPTAGQDFRHYTEIMRFIEMLSEKQSKTILLITHDMHLAIEYANRAIVFADGEVIADDAVFKILADDDIIERANLKHTSLYHLAKKITVSPEDFISCFIAYERRMRT